MSGFPISPRFYAIVTVTETAAWRHRNSDIQARRTFKDHDRRRRRRAENVRKSGGPEQWRSAY